MAMPTASSYQPWGTLPVTPVIQTCFQIYGTKRKATLGTHEQISSSAKRHCLHPVTHQQHPVEQSQSHPRLLSFPGSSSTQQQNVTSSSCQPDRIQEHFQTGFQQATSMQVEVTNIVQSECTLTQSQDGFYDNSVHSLPPPNAATSVSSLNPDNSQSETSKSNTWQPKGNNQRLFEQHNHNNRHEVLEELEFESNDYWDVPYDHHLLKMADEVERARIAMETDYHSPHQSSGLPSTDSTLIPASVPLQIHNTGNHIRCFCKPSWEGLLEPVSYI